MFTVIQGGRKKERNNKEELVFVCAQFSISACFFSGVRIREDSQQKISAFAGFFPCDYILKLENEVLDRRCL